MSSNMNDFTSLLRSWRTGVRPYSFHAPNHSDSNEVPVFYQSHSIQATPDDRTSGALDPGRLLEDRTPTGLYMMPDFPVQPHSRTRIYVHNGDMRRGFNPRLREILQQSSPPRSPPQISRHLPAAEVNTRSTALSKLKKEVYNPIPKQLAKRLSFYCRENSVYPLKETQKYKDEDGKTCAICLEDFEPREEVMLTPCKHMFHEECIVPWVTSQGQCPVCRLVICERERDNTANMAPSDIIARELLSILRAMGEAFHLSNGTD